MSCVSDVSIRVSLEFYTYALIARFRIDLDPGARLPEPHRALGSPNVLRTPLFCFQMKMGEGWCGTTQQTTARLITTDDRYSTLIVST